MENEMSAAIHISVELVVISAMLTIVLLFSTMGQSFSRDISNSIADTQAETYGVELEEIADYGALPASSLYVALEKNRSAINAISGSAYGYNIIDTSVLTSIFSKKVRITLTPIGDRFNVVVSPE